jgi:hypothetical protein
MGGMVYDGGFEGVLMNRSPKPEDVKPWDVVIGMDPGLKNAAFVWVGFDNDNRAYVFDECCCRSRRRSSTSRRSAGRTRSGG